MKNVKSNVFRFVLKGNGVVVISLIFCLIFLAGCQDEMYETVEREPVNMEMVPDRSEQSETFSENPYSEDGRQAILDETAVKKEYPDVPEIYWEILKQYEQAGKIDMNFNDDQDRLFWNENFGYVYDKLYLSLRKNNIYYSLEELTGDDFQELIIGSWHSGFGEEEQCKNGYYNVYVIYYIWEEEINWIECGYGYTTLYENGIVCTGFSGDIAPLRFYRFQPAVGKWEEIVQVQYVWGYNGIIGYSKGRKEDETYEIISEEEYNRIIDQYTQAPIELEWISLNGSSDEISQEALDEIYVKKEYPNVPEVYWEVLEQYEQAGKVEVKNFSDEQELLFWKDNFWYVYDELYSSLLKNNVYYSMVDLTGDGFPELIMGVWNSGFGEEEEWKSGFYNTYVIYYIWEGEISWIECGYGPTTLYENGIVRTGYSGVSEPWGFYRFQTDTGRWEEIVQVQYEWENGEMIGYSKGSKEDENHELISEAEYNQIIARYTKDPLELEWIPLNELSDG